MCHHVACDLQIGRTDHVSIAHSDDGSFTIETDHVLLRWSVASGVATSWNDALSITVSPFVCLRLIDDSIIMIMHVFIRQVKNVGKLGTVSWIPGTADTGNLGGTVRTLDGVSGPTTLSPGLISRDGWVVYDDSQTPVLARPETGQLITLCRHDIVY